METSWHGYPHAFWHFDFPKLLFGQKLSYARELVSIPLPLVSMPVANVAEVERSPVLLSLSSLIDQKVAGSRGVIKVSPPAGDVTRPGLPAVCVQVTSTPSC